MKNLNHEQLDNLLQALYTDIQNGALSQQAFVRGMGHLIGAVDQNNIDEVSTWLKQGVELFRNA